MILRSHFVFSYLVRLKVKADPRVLEDPDINGGFARSTLIAPDSISGKLCQDPVGDFSLIRDNALP